uniref:Monocarboxylate transporter 13-like n=1 Tax=Saccoglossus kowalevskii TaxID=10224 RepID=A0ABM0MBQ9_SACKO|nr:PREDICTED: monocarboxylate transporter 13-like [Saccoglossus kowalevskii]
MSTFFMGLGHKVTTVHFISKAVSDGINKLDAAILMTIMGTTSLIGRIIHGWFVDLGHYTPMFVSGCTFILAGASLLLVSVTRGNYIIFGAISAWYGFTMGICIPLGAVSVKYCLGVSHLSIAFGWTLLHSGIGNTLGPPLAGWIYDITENYNLSFVLAGSSLILSGSLLFTQLAYKRWQNKRMDSHTHIPCDTDTQYKDEETDENFPEETYP